MVNAPLMARRIVRPLVVLVALTMLTGGSALGADAKIDPEAKRVIDAFGKFYSGLKGFQFNDTVTVHVERQGQEQTQEFLQKFVAQRPNEFSYALSSDRGGAVVVSDGKNMSVYIKGFDRFAVEPAPATFAEMLANQFVYGAVGLGNAATVTAALLDADPAKKLLEKANRVEYGGLVQLDDVKCHLIGAVAEDMDWQLWIDAGQQPLVRQFVPDLQKALEKLAQDKNQKLPLEGMKITNTVTYQDWKIDPKLGPDAFAFHAPEGAAKVGSLMEIISGAAPMAEPAPHALVGKPAPPVDLELLDGGKLDLPAYKGKNVVILDFWATWCGPCVQAMPIIEKVAGKYEDKGVRLFAVNLEETPDEIRAFLDEAKLTVKVALDTNGAAAAAYLAETIPQTVLIGKDGTVQVVKVGLSPNLEAELGAELEALLAGKNLAAETLAAAKKKKTPAAETDADAETPQAQDPAK